MIRTGVSSQAGRLIWRELCLPTIARRERTDIVFSPMFFAPVLSRPAKSIVTVLDMVHELYPETLPRFRRIYFARLVRWCARRADHILTLSENARRDIITRMGIAPERVTPTPLAVGPQYDRKAGLKKLDEVREKYALPESYILYMGTCEPRKNLITLFEAYRWLLGRGHGETRLVIAGQQGWGTDDPRRKTRELGLTGKVTFTGYVQDEDQPAVYAGAELLAFPSLYEGFGLPPLEAMACGTPVVASNVASMPEVVGDAGILVDPLDARALGRAMESILSDQSLQEELRVLGAARARDFTWDRTARCSLEAIESAGRTIGERRQQN